MTGRHVRVLLGAVLITAACPSLSIAQQRTVDASAKAEWRHAQTGIVLPPSADGLPRRHVLDSGKDELDVSAAYQADDTIFATVYIYRPQISDAGMWFDRARSIIRTMPQYRAEASGQEVIGRLRPTVSAPEVGLRMVRAVNFDGNKSTGLATVPVGDWIVKIRMTGKISMDELDRRLTAFVQTIGWPEMVASPSPPQMLEPCSDTLKFGKAKLTKPDMAQAMLSGLILGVASSKKREAPSAPLCREVDAGIPYGVYRRVGEQDAYFLALNDAGRVVSITPAFNLKESKGEFQATLLDLDRSDVFPNFKGFPSPKTVMELLPKAQVVSSSKLGSSQINVTAPK